MLNLNALTSEQIHIEYYTLIGLPSHVAQDEVWTPVYYSPSEYDHFL